MAAPGVVHLLDYGAGNVRSVRNAIQAAGFAIVDVREPSDLAAARILVFPGVGCFSAAVEFLDGRGFREPLLSYIRSGRPFMGVCLGMQTLFESSEESPGVPGLGLIPGAVARFPASEAYSVPHIGWNSISQHKPCAALNAVGAGGRVYFVHSYRAAVTPENAPWVAATTDYGGQRFISAVALGNVFATQFHPEKSGAAGLAIFRSFLQRAAEIADAAAAALGPCPSIVAEPHEDFAAIGDAAAHPPTLLARRIVACLDVRCNDEGDLVVTKGDKYDVREKAEPEGEGAAAGGAAGGAGGRPVRNLGKPVDLCARYYSEGADEVAFLNITGFRSGPLEDAPMLAVLEAASERVFVPLTVGGGIRAYTDEASGRAYTALDVAARYFRAGADKVSIGSEAVTSAEAYFARGGVADGSSPMEQIARVYGRQAVVVSLDPRRVFVREGEEAEAARAAGHTLLKAPEPGPEGQALCWYQCTVAGGRGASRLDAVAVARASEALGTGELLVNCVDNDGQKAGYDEGLLAAICGAVRIPVIASSGAGAPAHFSSVFAHTRVEAALAAGIFHRREVGIAEVKAHVAAGGIPVRVTA